MARLQLGQTVFMHMLKVKGQLKRGMVWVHWGFDCDEVNDESEEWEAGCLSSP